MVDSTGNVKAASIFQFNQYGTTSNNPQSKGNFDHKPVSELPPVLLLHVGNGGKGAQSASVGSVGTGGSSAPQEYVPNVGAPDRKPDPAPKGAEILGRMDLDDIFRNNTLLCDRVASVAKELDLDPGLLAATLFAEVHNERIWSRTSGKVSSEKLGLDDWFAPVPLKRIKGIVAAHPNLDFDVKDVKKTGEMWDVSTEKAGAGEKPRGELSAKYAVAAVGVYLRMQIEMLADMLANDPKIQKLAIRQLADLTPEQRLTVSRAAMNAGVGFAKILFTRIAEGGDIPRTGKVTRDPDNAARTAVLHMARAIHLSQEIFGRPASDYTPPQAGLQNAAAAIMFDLPDVANLPRHITPIRY